MLVFEDSLLKMNQAYHSRENDEFKMFQRETAVNTSIRYSVTPHLSPLELRGCIRILWGLLLPARPLIRLGGEDPVAKVMQAGARIGKRTHDLHRVHDAHASAINNSDQQK
jgi:hypothetical protein